MRGYLLGDPELPDLKPVVRIEGETVPPDRVTAEASRVRIELPDALREKIRLSNGPCQPIRSFGIEMTVQYYGQGGWFSRLWRWASWPSTVNWTARVTPGARVYEVALVTEGTRRAEKAEPHTFSTKSGQVNFGCEEGKSTNASWNMPDGASNINVTSCRWVDMSNAKSHDAAHSAHRRYGDLRWQHSRADFERLNLLIGSRATAPAEGTAPSSSPGSTTRRFEEDPL